MNVLALFCMIICQSFLSGVSVRLSGLDELSIHIAKRDVQSDQVASGLIAETVHGGCIFR